MLQNCADIQIKAALSKPAVLPVPPNRSAPVSRASQPIYMCALSGSYHHDDLTIPNGFYEAGRRASASDRLKYTGVGVLCWTTRWARQDMLWGVDVTGKPNIQGTWQDVNKECMTCKANCMTPDKVCPSSCICRWFDWN